MNALQEHHASRNRHNEEKIRNHRAMATDITESTTSTMTSMTASTTSGIRHMRHTNTSKSAFYQQYHHDVQHDKEYKKFRKIRKSVSEPGVSSEYDHKLQDYMRFRKTREAQHHQDQHQAHDYDYDNEYECDQGQEQDYEYTIPNGNHSKKIMPSPSSTSSHGLPPFYKDLKLQYMEKAVKKRRDSLHHRTPTGTGSRLESVTEINDRLGSSKNNATMMSPSLEQRFNQRDESSSSIETPSVASVQEIKRQLWNDQEVLFANAGPNKSIQPTQKNTSSVKRSDQQSQKQSFPFQSHLQSDFRHQTRTRTQRSLSPPSSSIYRGKSNNIKRIKTPDHDMSYKSNSLGGGRTHFHSKYFEAAIVAEDTKNNHANHQSSYENGKKGSQPRSRGDYSVQSSPSDEGGRFQSSIYKEQTEHPLDLPTLYSKPYSKETEIELDTKYYKQEAMDPKNRRSLHRKSRSPSMERIRQKHDATLELARSISQDQLKRPDHYEEEYFEKMHRSPPLSSRIDRHESEYSNPPRGRSPHRKLARSISQDQLKRSDDYEEEYFEKTHRSPPLSTRIDRHESEYSNPPRGRSPHRKPATSVYESKRIIDPPTSNDPALSIIRHAQDSNNHRQLLREKTTRQFTAIKDEPKCATSSSHRRPVTPINKTLEKRYNNSEFISESPSRSRSLSRTDNIDSPTTLDDKARSQASSRKSQTASEEQVTNLLAKLNAVNRNNPEEALAQIDSILQEERCKPIVSASDTFSMPQQDIETDLESEYTEDTSVSSITNPTFYSGSVPTRNFENLHLGPISTASFRPPRPSHLHSYNLPKTPMYEEQLGDTLQQSQQSRQQPSTASKPSGQYGSFRGDTAGDVNVTVHHDLSFSPYSGQSNLPLAQVKSRGRQSSTKDGASVNRPFVQSSVLPSISQGQRAHPWDDEIPVRAHKIQPRDTSMVDAAGFETSIPISKYAKPTKTDDSPLAHSKKRNLSTTSKQRDLVYERSFRSMHEGNSNIIEDSPCRQESERSKASPEDNRKSKNIGLWASIESDDDESRNNVGFRGYSMTNLQSNSQLSNPRLSGQPGHHNQTPERRMAEVSSASPGATQHRRQVPCISPPMQDTFTANRRAPVDLDDSLQTEDQIINLRQNSQDVVDRGAIEVSWVSAENSSDFVDTSTETEEELYCKDVRDGPRKRGLLRFMKKEGKGGKAYRVNKQDAKKPKGIQKTNSSKDFSRQFHLQPAFTTYPNDLPERERGRNKQRNERKNKSRSNSLDPSRSTNMAKRFGRIMRLYDQD